MSFYLLDLNLLVGCLVGDLLLGCEQVLGGVELELYLLVGRAAERVAVLDARLGADGLLDVGAEERRELLEVLEAHVLEVDALLDAVVDGLARDGMRLAERHALLDEVVGEVGRIGEVLRHGLLHDVLADLHAADQLRVDSEAELHGVDRVEDALLVLLQILVVGKRQALDGRQHGHEVADDAARLAADELGDIRVLLLWHHRGARAVRIVELDEVELAAAPEDRLLREAREMDHENRGRCEKLHDVVAVADGVEAVRVDALEVELLLHELAVDREGRAGESTGAERHDVRALVDALEAGEVAREHAEVGEQMMREQDRLCALQMRVARHDDVAVLFSSLHQGLLELDQEVGNGSDFPANIEVRIEGYLIVAAPPRMKAFSRFANGIGKSLFNIHMNIFEFDRKIKIPVLDLLENNLQAFYDGVLIRFRNDAFLGQHRRMGDAAANIFGVHPAVKLNGCIEGFYTFICGLSEPAAP